MVDKFNYGLISTKERKKEKKETFPKYFLGENIKEAEKLFTEFKHYLNNISYNYSRITGIDQSDLFSEGILALGKAKNDYDSKKSNNFIGYAKFLIIDAMNEYVRHNKTSVKIPSYIIKTNRIINRIKTKLNNTEDWFNSLFNESLNNIKLAASIKENLLGDKELIDRAAVRAKIDSKTLVERAEFLPSIITNYIDSIQETKHETIISKLLVDRLMLILTENEQTVAILIMEDLNNSEIGRELNRSSNWVEARLSKIKKKILNMIK